MDLSLLEDAFRLGLGLDPGTDPRGALYGETEGWDSVGHMELIAALESTFEISLDSDEVFEMGDFQSVRRILEARLGSNGAAP
jgi:acyl carrier protein